MSKLLAVFGFDMETDVGSYTTKHDGVEGGTPRILEIFKNHKAEATFLFTARAAIACPDTVKALLVAGHEVGCHGYHHENFGEGLFDSPGCDPLRPHEVRGRLEEATDVVESISGVRPVSFRAPRLAGSKELVCALDDLGYRADASYPLYNYGEQMWPYHPSRENWMEKGDMKLLEIPNFANVGGDSSDPLQRDRDQWPLFRSPGAEKLMEMVRGMLPKLQAGGRPAVICFYMHPWEFIEIPPVLHLDEGDFHLKDILYKGTGEHALTELDKLLGMLFDEGAEIMTMEKFAEHWEETFCTTHTRA